MSFSTIIILILSLSVLVKGHNCPRLLSRTVRNILQQKVYPLFSAAKLEVPDGCPFNKERDMYAVQEEHKYMETMSKWQCDFCGKAFVSEYYLDQHFTNRHSDYIRTGDDIICFADFCDIMRCDIILGAKKAEFWDVSLCLEEDMKDLSQNCQNLMDKCIPAGLSSNMTSSIKDQLYNNTCSYLTCKNYWEAPPSIESDGTVMYIVFTFFLIVVLIVYYCVAYHYFYTDTFSDSYDSRYYDKHRSSFPMSSLRESELRFRTGNR